MLPYKWISYLSVYLPIVLRKIVENNFLASIYKEKIFRPTGPML